MVLSVACAVSLLACQGEPSNICDRERIFFAVDDVELGFASDVDPGAEGLQIDVVVLSTLDAGSVGRLFIVDADGVETAVAQSAIAGADGRFEFFSVTVPPGRIALTIRSASSCRAVQASRELFIFDDSGSPFCSPVFLTPPEQRELIAEPVFNAAADDDPGTDDLQTSIRVEVGRPDVDVTLLIRDVATGAEQILEQPSGDDLAAEYDVTLAQGLQALRAVCAWDDFPDTPLFSPTLPVFVDTEAPACTLVEPSAAVTAADDLDGDLGNGVQFLLVGQVDGGDAEGVSAQFSVGIDVVPAAPVAADGSTTATGDFPDPPPSPQSFVFAAADRAGNPCTDSASF